MRILFVAMPTSIHTVRWINQIADQGWDIHMLPSIVGDVVHPDLNEITVHHDFWGKISIQEPSEEYVRFPFLFKLGRAVTRRVFRVSYHKHYSIARLRKLIRKLKPDIVHSLEFQAAGYLTLEAKKQYDGTFPPWIATNWGSDIYLFGKLPEHEKRVREVLSLCDYYSCECERDVLLARKYGLQGSTLPVFPNAGGYDLKSVAAMRQPGPASARRLIMLKGYQNWAGRALVGLRALERCIDVLKGYEVVIYSASFEVTIAAELFRQATGIPVTIMPHNTPHYDILRMHGRARVSIGLSISDAISTSLLEAIVMGAFPIQSWTACADEWIMDGRTGILVPPEDPEVIEMAIRRALSDDLMIDKAAEGNYNLAEKRLDYSMLKAKTIDLYTAVAREKGILR